MALGSCGPLPGREGPEGSHEATTSFSIAITMSEALCNLLRAEYLGSTMTRPLWFYTQKT